MSTIARSPLRRHEALRRWACRCRCGIAVIAAGSAGRRCGEPEDDVALVVESLDGVRIGGGVGEVRAHTGNAEMSATTTSATMIAASTGVTEALEHAVREAAAARVFRHIVIWFIRVEHALFLVPAHRSSLPVRQARTVTDAQAPDSPAGCSSSAYLSESFRRNSARSSGVEVSMPPQSSCPKCRARCPAAKACRR